MAKHSGCERADLGGRGKASAECPECVAQVAASIIHTPTCRAAFGTRDAECGRCRALAAGVRPAKTYRRLGTYR